MSAAATRWLLVVAAFLAGLILCFTVVLLLSARSPDSAIRQAAAVGGPFRLIDQDGRPVTDQSVKGKPFLVFFGFTHCPDVCPTALFEVSEILRTLGPEADRVGAFFVTVDPERDTPEKLKDFLSSFDPRLRGLTGDLEAIQQIARSYRVYYKKVPLESGGYTVDHTALVYLMDKEGRFVAPFNLKRKPEDAAADLRRHL